MVLDHSFAVETYTAWVLLTVRTHLRNMNVGVWGGRWDSDSPTFTVSKSYVEALVTRRPASQKRGLEGDLLHQCQQMVTDFKRPSHIYSHQQGTFLDKVLDDVDSAAKRTTEMQPSPMPWR